MSKAVVVNSMYKDDFEEILEDYMNRGFRLVNAGYTPGHQGTIRPAVPLSAPQIEFWWAVLVKEA